MRKNSIKNNRINGEVQRELSEIIRSGVKDPRISPMTSVVSVQVAPDLKTCKVYISVLGSPEEAQQTLKGLKSAVGYIRAQLARNLNLRNTPELFFIGDQSIAYGVNMSHLIDEVAARDAEAERARALMEAEAAEADEAPEEDEEASGDTESGEADGGSQA